MTREHAIECLNFQNKTFFGGQSEALKMAISALSENEGEDKPQGYWIYPSYPNNYPYMWKSICSNCNTGFPTINKDYKFCPNCRAKMRNSSNIVSKREERNRKIIIDMLKDMI